jgi:hypothetical protein
LVSNTPNLQFIMGMTALKSETDGFEIWDW